MTYSSCFPVIMILLDCTWGSVRLVGGPFPNEGTVEVCLGQWSYVAADSYWTDTNAQVVCNQLGFTSQGSSKDDDMMVIAHY